MSRKQSPASPPEPKPASSLELQQVLCDLQSPDEWTRANAVRALCPCRRRDWGEPVYRYVIAMRDDPSPLVRGAVHHDLSENRGWNERWESRLIQERRARHIRVSVGAKATALADLCDQLREETGVPLWASDRVADEKVTLFCHEMPLRAVMQQLARPLGYAWAWQQKEDAGRLELVPDPGAGQPQKVEPPARRVRDHLLRSRVSLSLPAGSEAGGPLEKVTSADLLEALHRASGLPVVADFYTRLVAVEPAALAGRPLRELLDEVAKAMRLRWQFVDGTTAAQQRPWLQFRSLWGHFEQLQEVPNRLLARWSAWRRREGYLPLAALMEIANLPFAQRSSAETAEGAREIWGLAEWSLAATTLVEHLRFLAGFSPEQRQQATGAGLPFTAMLPEQQQRFLSLAAGGGARPRLNEPSEARLRVEYRPAGREGQSAARLAVGYRLGREADEISFAAAGEAGYGAPPGSSPA